MKGVLSVYSNSENAIAAKFPDPSVMRIAGKEENRTVDPALPGGVDCPTILR